MEWTTLLIDKLLVSSKSNHSKSSVSTALPFNSYFTIYRLKKIPLPMYKTKQAILNLLPPYP